jgi:hypothetical protein
VLGDPSLLAKTVVELDGISQRPSGKYYVKEAKHKIDAGYTVELKCPRRRSSATASSRRGARTPSR